MRNQDRAGLLVLLLPVLLACVFIVVFQIFGDEPWALVPRTRKDQLFSGAFAVVFGTTTMMSLLWYLSRATRGLSNSRLEARARRHLRVVERLATGSPDGAAIHRNPFFVMNRAKRATMDRLDRAIAALNGRANLNLAIGGSMILGGVLLLALGVLGPPPEKPVDLLLRFVPRATLAVLIEVFAFFFLRMYRDNLREMRYLQNEQTSQEARYVAATLGMQASEVELRASVIRELVATDRNLVPTLPTKERTTIDPQHVELLAKVVDALKKN